MPCRCCGLVMLSGWQLGSETVARSVLSAGICTFALESSGCHPWLTGPPQTPEGEALLLSNRFHPASVLPRTAWWPGFVMASTYCFFW